jgi:hypothetical protein
MRIGLMIDQIIASTAGRAVIGRRGIKLREVMFEKLSVLGFEPLDLAALPLAGGAVGYGGRPKLVRRQRLAGYLAPASTAFACLRKAWFY